MSRWAFAAAAFLAFPFHVNAAADNGLNLSLPTENDALFDGGGAAFYQHIERNYGGEKSTPWQGGQYGFVRNPVETAEGVVYSRFHEGIDIRPLHRDASGEPTDEVHAIADGVVVHTNAVAAWSNYGNYIVIEHRWGGSPYYSLYAHLASIAVRNGAHLARGDTIGLMGHTGEGLNQERAHLHLELNLMLNRKFESWYDKFLPTEPNHHGIYNGINLVGVDIARLYLALRKRPALTIPEFLADEEAFYRIAVPASHHFDLLKLYPWLANGETGGAKSWEIAFSRAGIPLKVTPRAEAVAEPQLLHVTRRNVDYSLVTRDVVGGKGGQAFLTDSGKRLMRLLTWPD